MLTLITLFLWCIVSLLNKGLIIQFFKAETLKSGTIALPTPFTKYYSCVGKLTGNQNYQGEIRVQQFNLASVDIRYYATAVYSYPFSAICVGY